MAARTGTAHVVTTQRTYHGKVYQTHLLRRSYRENGKVKNETLGNLSHLPDSLIEIIRRALKGETFVPAGAAFEVVGSLPHGHVEAVQDAMRRLGMASLLASQPCRERELVLAMLAARIVAPHTKLATTRGWHTTTLAEDFGVADADEDDLYHAMDWLLAHQDTIEQKLAKRHLKAGSLAMYDLSSSYFEGSTCPLARLGHSRDGRRGTLQVHYGLATDARGCPVAVSVYPGNTADPVTLLPAVQRLRDRFGIEQLVMVGDRGMLGHKAIAALKELKDVGWITALRSVSIRALVEGGQLQLGLFDERSLVEFTAPEYPGERLVACRNPELASLRAHQREALLAATEKQLQAIQKRVTAGRLKGADAIGVAVGKLVNRYKMAKHFELTITDHRFRFARKQAAIAAEAALDGLYILRTSLAAGSMDAADCVRHYKDLDHVERAFRSLKTVDLKVRPIHHRLADRVRAHIFLCMLAYYVEWHLREAWCELLFADPDQDAKAHRDPVARAQRSAAAQAKASRHMLADGTPVHSFATLMDELATVVRNTCRTPHAGIDAPTFTLTTTPTSQQRRALALVQQIQP